MKTVIMAAGNATRMADLTGNKIEKSFLRLGGRPIIRIVVDRILKNTKCTPRSVTVVCQRKFGHDFEHEFRDLHGLAIHELDTVLDTATNYYYCTEDREYLSTDVILLHYADTIIDLDYDDMLLTFLKSKAKCMIAVTDNIHHDYSEVHLDYHAKKNKMIVSDIIEKPQLHYPTWTGVAIFRHSFIMDYIDPSMLQDFAKNIFPKMLEDQLLYSYKVDKPYYDTGNIRSYTMLKEACDSGKLKL